MQNISLDSINPSDVKDFLRKLSIVNNRYVKKEQAKHDLQAQLEELERYKVYNTETEHKLRDRLLQLEEELQKVREERDRALVENRNKIDELSNSLTSVKTVVKELLQDKKEKIKHLEKKIKKK